MNKLGTRSAECGAREVGNCQRGAEDEGLMRKEDLKQRTQRFALAINAARRKAEVPRSTPRAPRAAFK